MEQFKITIRPPRLTVINTIVKVNRARMYQNDFYVKVSRPEITLTRELVVSNIKFIKKPKVELKVRDPWLDEWSYDMEAADYLELSVTDFRTILSKKKSFAFLLSERSDFTSSNLWRYIKKRERDLFFL